MFLWRERNSGWSFCLHWRLTGSYTNCACGSERTHFMLAIGHMFERRISWCQAGIVLFSYQDSGWKSKETSLRWLTCRWNSRLCWKLPFCLSAGWRAPSSNRSLILHRFPHPFMDLEHISFFHCYSLRIILRQLFVVLFFNNGNDPFHHHTNLYLLKGQLPETKE